MHAKRVALIGIGPFIVVAALILSIVLAPANAQTIQVSAVIVQHHKCFKKSKWGAEPGYRPCVQLQRIYEDGSFTYKTYDADGTVRYTSGVGALDNCTGRCD